VWYIGCSHNDERIEGGQHAPHVDPCRHAHYVGRTGTQGRATVAVNSLGVIDLLQIAVAGLQPGREYQLFLVDSLTKSDASRVALVKFKTWPNGAAVAQAIGPLRTVVGEIDSGKQSEQRYLIVIPIGSD
jgi:hypothetical protein